jgi:predicted Zn-dependent protease
LLLAEVVADLGQMLALLIVLHYRMVKLAQAAAARVAELTEQAVNEQLVVPMAATAAVGSAPAFQFCIAVIKHPDQEYRQLPLLAAA